MAFTFTFPDAIVVSDLKKNIGGSTDLAKKRHGSADMHTPIPLYGNKQSFSFTDTWTKERKTVNRLQKETL